MGIEEFKKRVRDKYKIDLIFSGSDDSAIIDIPRFSSGILDLDVCLGGGWPERKIIEIMGPESSAKTFVLDNAFKVVTNKPENNKCLLIDEEGSADKPWLKRIGLNLKNLEIVKSEYAEQSLDIMEVATASGEFAIIGLDSIAALIPKEEADKSTEEWQYSLTARLMNKACRKAYKGLRDLSRTGGTTSIFLLNQIRIKMGVTFGNPETTPGGNGVKFAASVRVDLRKDETLKDAAENVYGQKSRFTIIKNKCAPPLKKGDFSFYIDGPNKGLVNNYATLATFGLATGKITKNSAKGSWYEGEWLKEKTQGINKVAIELSKYDPKQLNKYLKEIEEVYLGGNPLMFKF